MGKIKKINWLDFLIPAILLTGFTILFRFTNLDISWQSYFWKESSGWFLKNAQPWHFLYHYSNLPALVISIAALMVLAIGFFKNRWRKYKKICLFLVLVIIIGPGLIINSLLKDNWGRPRPRDIEAFGGEYDYEQVLEINPESSGKSFPCGHCSMGFYFFVLFLLLRKSFKTTAFLLLLFGIILGSLIGIARLAQGGHFISDILWTAGLVYMSSAALYYLLGMHKSILYHSSHPIDKHKVKIVSAVFLLVILLIAAILSASPYETTKQIATEKKVINNSDYIFINFTADRTDYEIILSDSLAIYLEASGHGFPGSKLKTTWKIHHEDSNIFGNFSQRESGFFTEIAQTITVYIPKKIMGSYTFQNNKGNLILPEKGLPESIHIDNSNLSGNILK